jgi:hypothetical protein
MRRPEYVALVLSFLFVGFEVIIRVLTLALRTSLTPYLVPSTSLTNAEALPSELDIAPLSASYEALVQQILVTGAEEGTREEEK